MFGDPRGQWTLQKPRIQRIRTGGRCQTCPVEGCTRPVYWIYFWRWGKLRKLGPPYPSSGRKQTNFGSCACTCFDLSFCRVHKCETQITAWMSTSFSKGGHMWSWTQYPHSSPVYHDVWNVWIHPGAGITWVLGTGPLTKRLGCEMFIFSLCQVSILTTKEALFESHDQS